MPSNHAVDQLGQPRAHLNVFIWNDLRGVTFMRYNNDNLLLLLSLLLPVWIIRRSSRDQGRCTNECRPPPTIHRFGQMRLQTGNFPRHPAGEASSRQGRNHTPVLWSANRFAWLLCGHRVRGVHWCVCLLLLMLLLLSRVSGVEMVVCWSTVLVGQWVSKRD